MKITHLYNFDYDPRFPTFLLYVRWKSGVTFLQRCFRDANVDNVILSQEANGPHQSPEITAIANSICRKNSLSVAMATIKISNLDKVHAVGK